MGEDARGGDRAVSVSESKRVSIASSAAPSKQVLAARKKAVKSLKSRDTAKKIEAARYSLQDELFLQEPDVLSLLLVFLTKTKVREVAGGWSAPLSPRTHIRALSSGVRADSRVGACDAHSVQEASHGCTIG